MQSIHHTCKSCGQQFQGRYCNDCGEKVIEAADRSFRKFLSDIIEAMTLADNKFFRSLILIILRPGFLSREMAEGRRVKYLRPLSVFFALNLIYFLFPVIQLFNASLKTQLATSYRPFVETTLAHQVIAQDISVQAFEVLYNQKTTGLAKLLVFLFVLLASLPLNLLYQKRNRFFTDHLTLTLELVCFNLFINALLLSLIARFFALGSLLDDGTLLYVFLFTNSYFLLRATFTFYQQRGIQLILKSLLMMAVLKLSLEAYRFILFLLTIISL